MQLWFSRRSDVSLRDQLVTQIILGILGRDLAPGERLPSTRQLARRFRLHPNTVSAAYRRLEQENWIELRRGSGVYVRRGPTENPSDGAPTLDVLLGLLLRSARAKGIPSTQVRARLRQWLDLQPPDHFLLIEPDAELRRILLTEMQNALTLSVEGCGLEECGSASMLVGAVPVALANKIEDVRRKLPAGTDLLPLHIQPVGKSLASYLPAPSQAMVGVASRWTTFVKTARTMLIASGFHPDCLILRDATKPNWQRGLQETAAVLCDSLTAGSLKGVRRVLTFQLLSEPCLQELQEYEHSIRGPLTG
jgi:DNA-binding transcriptional regulator YhcF (GntR family)